MIELLLLSCMGLTFLIIGWRIWKNKQITLIHDYHYTKVSDDNISAYTEKMGKAIIIIGIGVFVTGIIDFITKTSYGWFFFAFCFIFGFILILATQKKYNGGLF